MDARKWLKFGFGGLVVCAASTFVTCQIYDHSLLDPDTSVPAGSGIGFWSGQQSNGCFSARMPTAANRPSPQDDSAIEPIYLALRTLKLGGELTNGKLDPNSWKSIGFDLDGKCTNSETCTTGDRVETACKFPSAAVPFDGQYCRDNSFGRLANLAQSVPDITGAFGLSSDAFNCALCAGTYNILIKVSGYNGKDNDDRVRIDLYPSSGLETPLPWSCANDDWRQKPCFTVDQAWKLRSEALSAPVGAPDPAPAKYFVDDAYVRNGQLVSRLPENTLFWFPRSDIPSAALPLTIQRGIFVAKLVRDQDTTYRLDDGIIAGAVRGTDLTHAFRLLGLCDSDPNYTALQTFITTGLDLTADPTASADTVCDSMSMAIGFTAVQSTPGRVESVPELVECSPRQNRDAGAEGGGDAGRD